MIPSGKAVQAHYAALAEDYDARANQACKRVYRELVERWLGDARRMLEIGAGGSPLLTAAPGRLSVACDFSAAMLSAQRPAGAFPRVAADGQCLPFPGKSFDAVFSINLLEHVPDPARVLAEAVRVLTPGGRFLTVTPCGDAAMLLELLERLHLKLPEGPHRFLTWEELHAMAAALVPQWRVLEHRRFLAFPAGPMPLVYGIDRLFPQRNGWGLFQYLLVEMQ